MRYLPHTETDRREMLKTVGVPSIDALYKDVPDSVYLKAPVEGLPDHQGELEVERHLKALSAKSMNTSDVPSFVGAGAYHHHVPATVDYIIQRGEFLTSYTPYQPEIAQGTLQYLFEFQTQVAAIMGMDVANASMYDGSTACVEAAVMANRITRRTKVILSGNLHPHYQDVVKTHAHYAGFTAQTNPTVVQGEEDLIDAIDDQTSCVVVQYPDFFGNIQDYTRLAQACQENGALLITVTTEILSLGALTPPGDFGADIAVAEGQSIGNHLNFGGPYVGLFTTRQKYVRQMPGRLAGKTVDVDGKTGYVLTLNTREQHIRREKATSNICTNSGLCALAFTVHMSLLGETGYKQLAAINHGKAVQMAEKLETVGVEVLTSAFFNEFTVRLKKPAAQVVETLASEKILAGVPVSRFYPDQKDLANLLLIAVTELNTEQDMDQLIQKLGEV